MRSRRVVGSLLGEHVEETHLDQFVRLKRGFKSSSEISKFAGARVLDLSRQAARILKVDNCAVERSGDKRDAHIADRAAEVRDCVLAERRQLRRGFAYLYSSHVTKLSMGLGRCVRPFLLAH